MDRPGNGYGLSVAGGRDLHGPRRVGLKPHLADTFKLSTDPLVVDKVVDVVGLYQGAGYLVAAGSLPGLVAVAGAWASQPDLTVAV